MGDLNWKQVFIKREYPNPATLYHVKQVEQHKGSLKASDLPGESSLVQELSKTSIKLSSSHPLASPAVGVVLGVVRGACQVQGCVTPALLIMWAALCPMDRWG